MTNIGDVFKPLQC